MKCVDNTTIV